MRSEFFFDQISFDNQAKFIQFYETTILDNDTNLSAHFILVPDRSLPGPDEINSTGLVNIETSEYYLNQLGLRDLFTIDYDDLSTLLAAVISHAPQLSGSILDTSFEAERVYRVQEILNNPDLIPRLDREFADRLVNERFLPFERSPLAAISLSELAKAGGVGIGAYMGFVVAGTSPLIFISVPAGMIICGAAAGIAMGLQAGLKERLMRLIAKTDVKQKRKEKKKNTEEPPTVPILA